MSTNRLEAFSDGVFAIAITLLVLDIHVPEPGSGRLGHELLAQWPSYAAYVISFITIGIIWMNHHAAFSRLRAVDHSILIWNLLLLMSVGILPFTTSLMATYLKEGSGEDLAAAIYGASFLVMGGVFVLANRQILFRRPRLLREPMPEEAARRTLHFAALGQLPYLLAVLLAFVSPYITLAICAACAVYYALPVASRAGDRDHSGGGTNARSLRRSAR
ncbi:MAG TPA: TMEM175 family protein [Solirubrobacterales bacterium]|nr:TMEM175 family protein [Solirubrobacterales bacterium]